MCRVWLSLEDCWLLVPSFDCFLHRSVCHLELHPACSCTLPHITQTFMYIGKWEGPSARARKRQRREAEAAAGESSNDGPYDAVQWEFYCDVCRYTIEKGEIRLVGWSACYLYCIFWYVYVSCPIVDRIHCLTHPFLKPHAQLQNPATSAASAPTNSASAVSATTTRQTAPSTRTRASPARPPSTLRSCLPRPCHRSGMGQGWGMRKRRRRNWRRRKWLRWG